MAYIPPHKRHSGDMKKPSPTAELLGPIFNRKLNLRPFDPHFTQKLDLRPSVRKGYRSSDIIYADQAIDKWFSIGGSGSDRSEGN